MRYVVGAIAAVLMAVAAFAMPAMADSISKRGAVAAEVPAAAPSWTGLYVGAHAGKGWGDWNGTIETTAGCKGTCPSAGYDDPTHTLSGNGWIGGGQLGYNWQSGNLVLGLEADVTWSDLDASGQFATDQYGSWVWDKSFKLSLDYFGTARARLGLATGSVLPYVTGGLAWARTSGDLAVAQSHLPNKIDGVSHASVNESHIGWTIGGGVEWKLSQSLSLKAEYLYIDLGEQEYLFKGKTFTGAPFDTDSFRSDLDMHIARVGLNYRFGGN